MRTLVSVLMVVGAAEVANIQKGQRCDCDCGMMTTEAMAGAHAAALTGDSQASAVDIKHNGGCRCTGYPMPQQACGKLITYLFCVGWV